jgi:hypothetical protein
VRSRAPCPDADLGGRRSRLRSLRGSCSHLTSQLRRSKRAGRASDASTSSPKLSIRGLNTVIALDPHGEAEVDITLAGSRNHCVAKTTGGSGRVIDADAGGWGRDSGMCAGTIACLVRSIRVMPTMWRRGIHPRQRWCRPMHQHRHAPERSASVWGHGTDNLSDGVWFPLPDSVVQ